ncbi:MAG TPA: hypothetical protein VKV40_23820 [Ktedonobacteraceae bacterium]|jgi:CRISPR-associated protein Csc3|nr:hypothetical protein [Ktedonobacteraceae bacterium]
MKELKKLAVYAARHRIRGRSYKRNSLLKPLDFILGELTRYPTEVDFACDSSKGLIYDHVKRVARGVHEEAIYEYVDLFKQEVLGKALHGNVNKLSQRERSLRSAYLVYMREELAEIFIARGKATTPDEALAQIEQAAAEEADLEAQDELLSTANE